jgi:hypothetical protein
MGSWSAVMEVMRRAAGDTQTHRHHKVSFLHYLPVCFITQLTDISHTTLDFCSSINKDIELAV